MFQFQSKIRYSEVDSEGKLTLLSLLDYFQDCSVFQSESIHYGIDYLKENHQAWVLSSWQICLNQMPRLTDPVYVRTWPYEMKGFYGLRYFAMDGEDGTRYASANTTWVYMDTESGRPCRIPKKIIDAYEPDSTIDFPTADRKIPVPKEYKEMPPVTVPAFFIDTNHHMNNSRYVMVAQEFLPEDFKLQEVRVEYKHAAMLGDVIFPRVTAEDSCIIVNLAAEDGKPYAIVRFISNTK